MKIFCTSVGGEKVGRTSAPSRDVKDAGPVYVHPASTPHNSASRMGCVPRRLHPCDTGMAASLCRQPWQAFDN
eukprot:3056112-Pyramimonas_sp.AAC.1